jgi:hypothetical protein
MDEGPELRFFSNLQTLGTALDITVAELAIESFFRPSRKRRKRCTRLLKRPFSGSPWRGKARGPRRRCRAMSWGPRRGLTSRPLGKGGCDVARVVHREARCC